jgi:hypothetical protein
MKKKKEKKRKRKRREKEKGNKRTRRRRKGRRRKKTRRRRRRHKKAGSLDFFPSSGALSVRTLQEDSHLKVRKRALPRNQVGSTLILDFQPP